MAPDPLIVDSKHYKLEFENDRVRVLRITYGPHEKSVMHGHPAGIVVILNDCDFRFYLPRGQKQVVIGKAGQILSYDEPQEHQPENLSDKPFEGLFIELKA